MARIHLSSDRPSRRARRPRRIALTGGALALAGAVIAGGCAVLDPKDPQAELIAIATRHAEELDEGLVVEYGKPVHVEMTAARDPNAQDFASDDLLELILKQHPLFIEQNPDWAPAINLTVDNARILADTYLCLDFEITNNIPQISHLQNKKWDWFMPDVFTDAGTRMGNVLQFVDAEGVELAEPRTMGRAGTVEMGIPGLDYVDSTASRGLGDAYFAELGETTEGGLTIGKNDADEGLTDMPLGGTLSMTRCWWGGASGTVHLLSPEEMKAPQSMKAGAYVLGMSARLSDRTISLLVPFALAD